MKRRVPRNTRWSLGPEKLSHLLLTGAAVLAAGCAGLAGADGPQERTVLVDYDHDQVASTFMAYFPRRVKVHAGDEVVFRQQWTGEGHSVTMGTYVDEMMEIARPLMEQYPDEEPPPEVVAPLFEIFNQLPMMVAEEDLTVNQNGAQPCFLDEGLPPDDPDTPCSDAQQRQPAFNGRQSYYNSGFIPYEGPSGNEFRVRMSDDITPGTYSYYCNLHQFFQNGTIEVVPDSEPIPSQAEVSRQAFDQIKATAEPLLKAYRAALDSQGETEVVGLTVSKPFAGWTPESESIPGWINEFVPQQIDVEAGQSVTWSFVGAHTVSFDVPAYFSEFIVEPDGTVEWSQDAVQPRGRRLVTEASEPPGGSEPAESPSAASGPPPSESASTEATESPTAAPTEPPDESASSEATESPTAPPTGPPADGQEAQESEEDEPPIQHVDAGRWNGRGFLSSGVQSGGSYTVTFTTPGTYPYACLIHPRMVGEVVVR
jgi:plastocyanin